MQLSDATTLYFVLKQEHCTPTGRVNMSKRKTNFFTSADLNVSDALLECLPAKSCIPGLWLHSNGQAEFSADDHRRIAVVGFHSGQMLVHTLRSKNRWNTDLSDGTSNVWNVTLCGVLLWFLFS